MFMQAGYEMPEHYQIHEAERYGQDKMLENIETEQINNIANEHL